MEERPFLAAVEFRGLRALRREEIEAALRAANAEPQLARPLDPVRLQRAARVIADALREQGYADAHVTARQKPAGSASARAVFKIAEGPRLPVREVRIEGIGESRERDLLRQMQAIRPNAWLAALRRKNIYTATRAEQDAARIVTHLRDRGYPMARTGAITAAQSGFSRRAWFPWPRHKKQAGLSLIIPVELGQPFAWDSFSVIDCRGLPRDEAMLQFSEWKPGQPYSRAKIEQARASLAAALPCDDLPAEIRAHTQFNRENGSAHLAFEAKPRPALSIRRIDFTGNHRFPERFYRSRIKLAEGAEYHAAALEAGLRAIARDGYVQPLQAEDVEVRAASEPGAVDVRIRVREAGRQRISLVGGASTIGLAYNLFNLFGREEMLVGHLEGGPPAVQILLSVVKAGLLKDRASLAFSLFHNVVQPRLPGHRNQRLFTSVSTGISQTFEFSPSRADAIALRYRFSANTLTLPTESSAASTEQRSESSASEVALQWTRDLGATRFTAVAAASGGWLGGSQDLLRASGEAAAMRPDRFSRGRNRWAARLRSDAAATPPWTGTGLVTLNNRLFPGAELVRGLRTGELSPASEQTGSPAGANLVQAANLEYRVPLGSATTQWTLVPFADAAAGWLLDSGSWSGQPAIRAALGLELHYRLPERLGGKSFPLAGETIRVHYALAPFLRGAGGRKAAWGWALAPLF